MLKVNSSRADVIGKLNNMPDVVSFASVADAFNRLVPEAAATQALAVADEEVLAKDTSHANDLNISEKGWMISQGYLSLPTMTYEARIGALEARELTVNPIADEGPVSVTVGGSFVGNVDFTGDTDDIRVFLVAGQTYLISLRGTSATPVTDTFLEVYNPSAALVNFDDDGGNGTFSIMTITAATTGNYTIRASSFSNPGDPGLGQYTVDVRVQGADAVGDTNATAVVLSQGTTFGFRETATVSGGNDLDRYEVQLEAGKFYTFKLAAGADYATDYTAVPAGEIDTILRLRNAGGTLLVSNDDNAFPNDISSGFSFLAQTTGTYYLDVTGYAGQTGGYVIDFNEVDYKNADPLQSIRWVDADNIDTVDVNGTPTAYVYFGLAGENFGQSNFAASWGWTAKEKAAVMSALLEYTKITGIQYVETLNQAQAEFRINTVNGPNPPVNYGAYFFPQDPAYGAAEGVGMFNVNSGGWDKPGVSTQDIPGDQVSLNKGGFSYAVILHEFGHAHGLAHPHDNGGGSDILLGVTAPTNSYGIFNLNQGVYTVMSYNDAWDFHPDGPSPFTIGGISQGWSGTLGAFDIAVLQERYGVHAYATGNDVYTISATQPNTYYQTIWDTGGTDAINYSGTGNAVIDLRAATLRYEVGGAGWLSFVDQIPGTAGADGIWGGYTIANGVVIENAAGGSGSDVLVGNDVDNVLEGNGGIDLMYGLGGNDTLSGGDGNDVLNGGTGNDTLNGGTGDDGMVGGAGDDIFLIDSAGDSVFESTGEGYDRAVTTVSYTLTAGAFVEALQFSDLSATTTRFLAGNDFANDIYGDEGANTLYGGGGGDTLFGGGGDDVLWGEIGDDALVGGDGGDLLIGGEGSDYLVGGAGADAFAFTNPLGASNVDSIADFVSGGDRILLSSTYFGMPLGAVGANAFVVGAAAQDADDRIIYDNTTGALYYDADGNGAGAAVQFATLLGTPALLASDIQIV